MLPINRGSCTDLRLAFFTAAAFAAGREPLLLLLSAAAPAVAPLPGAASSLTLTAAALTDKLTCFPAAADTRSWVRAKSHSSPVC